MLAFIHKKKILQLLNRSYQVQREGVPSLFHLYLPCQLAETWLVFGHNFHDCSLNLSNGILPQIISEKYCPNVMTTTASATSKSNRQASTKKQDVPCGVVCFRIDSYFISSAAQRSTVLRTTRSKQSNKANTQQAIIYYRYR